MSRLDALVVNWFLDRLSSADVRARSAIFRSLAKRITVAEAMKLREFAERPIEITD